MLNTCIILIILNLCCIVIVSGHLNDNEKLWFIHYYCKITSVTLSDNKESLVPLLAPVSLLSVRVFVLFVNGQLLQILMGY